MDNASEPETIDLLYEWAKLGIELKAVQGDSTRLKAGTNALIQMGDAGNAYGAARLDHLRSIVEEWEVKLGHIQDPLRTRFALNRWLAKDREEAYADWLSWLFQEVGSAELVFYLLFGKNSSEVQSLSAAYTVHREVWVPEGHKGKAGRLDCVIIFDDAVIVIELKKYNAENSDTAKHEGYLKWLNSRQKDFRRGLIIATSSCDLTEYQGFSFLNWELFCHRARRLACKLSADNRLSFVAVLCAFIGAVEQNLLGLPHVGSLENHHELRGLDLERTIVYLKNWSEDVESV